MLKVERYIGVSLVWCFFASLVIIVGLDAVAALVDEMGKIRGDYTITEVFLYVSTTLPGRIYEFVPFAALIGSLISLGQFSSSSEIVVMRAAGLTKGQLVWITLKPIIFIALLSMILGESLVPISDLIAENRRNTMLNKAGDGFGRFGVWKREGNTFIHFNTVSSSGQATGVTLFKFDEDQSLISTLKADKAIFEKQLNLASEADLPVVIHTREADDDTIEILKNYSVALKKKGVIHSFTSTMKLAEFCLSEGFKLGFNGIATFKSAVNVREVIGVLNFGIGGRDFLPIIFSRINY